MIENLRPTSPGPETGCRGGLCSDSSAMIELKGEGQKCVRRKRLKLRGLKSLDQLQSGFPDGDRCFKRKRSENGKLVDNKRSDEGEEFSERKSAVVSLSFASSPSNDQLTKEDVVIAGTSSFVDDKIRSAGENAKDVRCWSHGSISVIGRRREMEDAVAVELGCLTIGSKGYDFFGVYDGHGGSRVAHACRDRLHKVLEEIVEQEDNKSTEDSINWNKVMLESFEKIDEEVNRNGAAVATMGSTAVVAVIGEEEVVVANCGDSRAVLSRGGVAVPLSNDHKPDRSDELERIELSGGKVINWNGQRILGVLATSRSIGDHYLKPYVISDPEILVTKRTGRDEFLILASDGLWDVISNDLACHVVRRCLDGQIRRAYAEDMVNGKRSSQISTADGVLQCNGIGIEGGSPAADAAAVLAELAIARGSKDNISVIVVELRR